MKIRLIVILSILFMGATAFAADIPEKYRGEWQLVLVSKDDQHFVQATTSIGLMGSDNMMARGQVQVFEDVVYNERYRILTLSFKMSPTVWVVYPLSYNRVCVKVYVIDEVKKKNTYLQTMLIDIYH